MCSHRSGCDEELLLSSSELFPQWWLCSRGFLALFFWWNVHGPSPWLFWSETGTLPLLTVGFAPVFPTLDPKFLQADTTLSIGLAFRQPLLEELMLTKPCITQHPQEAHFVLTGTYFALKRPGISSNCFPLESARAWKSWPRLPKWSQQECGLKNSGDVTTHQSGSGVQLRTPGLQVTCGDVRDGLRTDSKG